MKTPPRAPDQWEDHCPRGRLYEDLALLVRKVVACEPIFQDCLVDDMVRILRSDNLRFNEERFRRIVKNGINS